MAAANLNLCILAAGSGGMYCGSCMRDNVLAGALLRQGHRVTLVPLYTPLRTETDADANVGQVYYGGINVYLQHRAGLFRHMPRAWDWLLDRSWLLKIVGRLGVDAQPARLAGLTLSVLKGEHGPTQKELHRLIDFLRVDVKPGLVSVPNLMFVGMAETLRRELSAPVVCELTGEDIFLDAMRPADRDRVQKAIRAGARNVSRFVATSSYYAGRMADYLGIAREQIEVVYPGIPRDYLRDSADRPASDRPPTIGFLARACPEKGLAQLIDAVELLQRKPGFGEVRLEVGGYVGKRDHPWYAALQDRVAHSPLARQVIWHGEVTREQKIQLLDSVDVFSAPTPHPEPKGIFVLESLARRLPVVLPDHGSFPELIGRTGGGLLVPPRDAAALADSLAGLLADASRRQQLGDAGRRSVGEAFTDEQMAQNMVRVYEELLAHG